MIRRRALLAVPVAVGLLFALVPPLRDQARFQWVTLPRHLERVPQRGQEPPRVDPIMDWAASYRRRSARFVEERFPRNSEMLMAAGLLAPNGGEALRLLERAASGSDPVTLSAYVDALLERGPYYVSPATIGVDPAWTDGMAAARREIRRNHLPTALSEKGVASVLVALARWREADPGNAVPAAVEAWCLYGLGRREQALLRWCEAERLPKATTYAAKRAAAVRRLLVGMGLPAAEAAVTADAMRLPVSLDAVMIAARIAYHEGRRSQLAGRGAFAIGCWSATTALGQRLQEWAGLVPEFQRGAELQALGASPAWCWLPDASTGFQGAGPGIMRGRFFYGPQHAFYRSHVGGRRDAELRDAVVAAKTRSMMLQQIGGALTGAECYTEAGELLVFGQLLGGFLIVSGISLAVVAWRRPVGDSPCGSPWRYLSSAPALLVLAVAAGVAIALSRECAVSPLRIARGQDLLLGVGLAVATAFVAPIVPGLLARRRGGSARRAWIDSLRAGLLAVIVVGALIYFGLGLGAMQLRARWVSQELNPVSEMDRARRLAGFRWDNPPMRPGSWVESYPPAR